MHGDQSVNSQQSPVTLSLTRCPDYEPIRLRAALLENLAHLGGLEHFVKPGESVMIKPNLISPLPREQAAQTDPEMIVQLAILLKDMGAKPFVADSPAWGTIADCVRVLNLTDSLKKLDVPVRQLDEPRRIRVNPSGARVGISSVALEADKIINLPKLKAHRQLGATIAVKNMFGCVSGKSKAFWHFRRGGTERKFCEFLIGVYNSVTPVLTIVDGITAMEGAGPMNGQPRNLGIIVTSADPFACEAICADIIGIQERDLPILRTARELGMLAFSREDIVVLGTKPSECICRDFHHMERIPIKFKFHRVCGSIAKQLIKLAASAIRRPGTAGPDARVS
jgi:uncharacterized protein (DUF362 family)